MNKYYAFGWYDYVKMFNTKLNLFLQQNFLQAVPVCPVRELNQDWAVASNDLVDSVNLTYFCILS